MATNLPASTGDILEATTVNGLVAFQSTITDKTADYTIVLADQYQVIIAMNKATAIALKIPTDATAALAVGSVITVLNKGVGTCTISAVTPGTTTVLSAGATAASPTLTQYRSCALIKTAANAWYVVGAIG